MRTAAHVRPWRASRTGRTRRLAGTGPPWSAIIAGAGLAGLLLAAVGAEVVRPDEHLRTDFSVVMQSPSWSHPLGTDDTGRDLLALLLRALRTSLTVSALAAVVALVVGAAVGLVAGAVGGRVDAVAMRAIDFFASQNHLLFGILIAVLAHPVVGGAGAVTLAVGLTHWMRLARILRAEVLSLRERPFVAAAVGIGATRRQVIARHLLPHVLPAAGVGFVLLFPHAIFHESALSFLGVGMPSHEPSLGMLIADGQQSLFAGAWWVVLFPGFAIVFASVAIGTVGEWWQQRQQPRWRAELEL
ncbi:ABC transporter permease [Egibacter rhizosphaerae]|uniref:ABC transporter permease n=1 Tax=Egibacter rhizosphaerae TaxID=1670831 RepID=A0A411YFI8_9ACTN|nr:ABC transporter permease [Egibacter rhizosphaerae]QBI19939.1 ABC transporter permease [Egibacter rhizosphaerae]